MDCDIQVFFRLEAQRSVFLPYKGDLYTVSSEGEKMPIKLPFHEGARFTILLEPRLANQIAFYGIRRSATLMFFLIGCCWGFQTARLTLPFQ